MKALSIVVLAVVALALAEDAKEAKDLKLATPYAFPAAYGYGYQAAAFPYGYYGYPAAYPAEKYFSAPAVKFAAPSAYSYGAYPYYAGAYPYAGAFGAYPYAAAPAVSSYSFKLDDTKEPSAYLPGAFPYSYGYGYPFAFAAKKE